MKDIDKFVYELWTVEIVMAKLRELGCTCTDNENLSAFKMPDGTTVRIAPGISQDSYASLHQPRSYRCLHTCNGCGENVLEIADPTYDGRQKQMQRIQGAQDKD